MKFATESGHSCHTFLKGAALQQKLRRESFDLLLIDWELPDTKGPDVVRWVREQISKDVRLHLHHPPQRRGRHY